MKYRLNIACQTSALAGLRSFIQGALVDASLDENEKHQVTLAVEEVCANLIIHSHACNPEDSIQLEIIDSPEKLIFEVSDQGIAFNILNYQTPDLKEVMLEKRKGGLGIILVRKIMDEIEFESKNGTNTCRLIKWFRS
jgi:serine/threonine-protein kinase RsbW